MIVDKYAQQCMIMQEANLDPREPWMRTASPTRAPDSDGERSEPWSVQHDVSQSPGHRCQPPERVPLQSLHLAPAPRTLTMAHPGAIS
jgi:hypothetical protein